MEGRSGEPRRRGPARKALPHAQPGPRAAVDEEIRHHLVEKAERLMEQGFDPEEARREAERRFGNVDRIRASVQAVDRLHTVRALRGVAEDVGHDLRFAVRAAARAPWFALAVVATLGVGIGANVAIFSAVEAALMRPLPFPDPERIAYVHEVTPQGMPFAVAPANYLDWRERLGSFEAMAAVAGGDALVTEGGEPERVPGARVSSDYFRVLGVEPAMGRTFAPTEDVQDGSNVVVVSHAFWSSRLGRDPDAVGRTVRLDGDPYTVIGVMPEDFRAYRNFYSPSPIELWRPNPFANDPPTERMAKRLVAIARLQAGIGVEQAEAELSALASVLAEEHPDTNGGWGTVLFPLSEAMRESARAPLLMLLGGVAFILLIACLNVGNLLLARADTRRSSISVRRALGASRTRIGRQLLTESLVLSLAGAALGVGLARALLPVLVATSPIHFTRIGEVGVNAAVLVFALVVAVATAVATGLAPALGTSARSLVDELNDGGHGKTDSRRRRIARSALVVGEIALSVVLVIGAGLMLGSYVRLSGLDLGFEPERIIRVGALLPRDRYADPVGRGSHPETRNFTLWRPRAEEVGFMEGVEAEMARLQGVESVAAGNFDPMPGLMWASTMRAEGDPPPDPQDERAYVAVRAVSPGWFETLRIPIVRGRALQGADRAGGEDVVVLDEAAAERLWPDRDPIGRSVIFGDGIEDLERPFRVVGVARSTRQAIFDNAGEVLEEVLPVAYLPYRRQAEAYVDWQIAFRMRSVFLVRTNRDLGEIAPELRQVVARFDSELPVTVERLTDTIASPLSNRRFYMGMLVAFGTLALILVVSGVFAVMAYTVTRNKRELGIRLALGARGAELKRAELARGLRLGILGLALGGVGAVWLTRFIATFLYGVGTVDPATYSAVVVLILSVVLAAAYVPARRASAIDPMESLRTE